MKSATTKSRVRVGDILVDPLTEQQVRTRLEEYVLTRKPHQVVTANLRFVTIAHRDITFAQIVNNSDLVVADGMPLVWASKIAGTSILPSKMTGPMIVSWCAQLAAAKGYSFFLLGSKTGVAERAAEHLETKYPGLRIAGTQHGYLSTTENSDTIERIRRVEPEFLFVAMGCPKQEQWIAAHLKELQVPVCIGVGGTFEVLAGHVRGAPRWVQNIGMEWFFRLVQEPERLWKRYLLEDLPTGVRIGVAAIRQRFSFGHHL